MIKQLETKLGVVLLTRTTRTVTLTQAGERFLREAGPAIDAILNVLDSLGNDAQKPSGLLRLNVLRLAYPQHIESLITKFSKKFPDVSVEVFLEDTPLDVFESGFDAGIRLSDILAKDMVAIKIFGPVRFVTVAAPKYLKKAGRPPHPRDLHSHRCIVGRMGTSRLYDRWEFEYKAREFQVQVKPSLIMNDPLLMINAAMNGLGIVYIDEELVKDRLKSGRLEIILNQYAISSAGYYLYFPSRSQVQPKLRAFIDLVKETKLA